MCVFEFFPKTSKQSNILCLLKNKTTHKKYFASLYQISTQNIDSYVRYYACHVGQLGFFVHFENLKMAPL